MAEDRSSAPSAVVPLRQPQPVALPTLLDAWRDRQPQAVFPTSHPLLSLLLGGGLRAGQLYICSSNPGAGKTSMALAVIAQPAVLLGYPVLYVSAELDGDWIAARYAAMTLNVPWLDVLDGVVPDHRVEEALQGRVHVLGPDHAASYEDAIKQMHAWYQSSFLIIVDFMQLLALPFVVGSGRATDIQAVNRILLDFRRLARTYHVPVWAISSTPRSLYATEGSTEQYLGAAKQSGELEYLALAVLHLRARAPQDNGLRPIEVHIPKGRLSGSSNLVLLFNGANGTFHTTDTSVKDVRTHDLGVEVLEAIAANRAKYGSAEAIARDIQRGAKDVREALNELEKRGKARRIKVSSHTTEGEGKGKVVWDIVAPHHPTSPNGAVPPPPNGQGPQAP